MNCSTQKWNANNLYLLKFLIFKSDKFRKLTLAQSFQLFYFSMKNNQLDKSLILLVYMNQFFKKKINQKALILNRNKNWENMRRRCLQSSLLQIFSLGREKAICSNISHLFQSWICFGCKKSRYVLPLRYFPTFENYRRDSLSCSFSVFKMF